MSQFLNEHGWNILVLGTVAYAVFWLGHSGWWFLFAIMFVAS